MNFKKSDYADFRLDVSSNQFCHTTVLARLKMEFGFNNGAIKLDSTNDVYYSGQTITGDVVFRLIDTENITALNIQFVGVAKVLWSEVETEKRNGTTFKTRVDYKGQEQYFNDVQCLLGEQGVKSDLRPGTHSFPFKYQIPATAPSTFKAEKGEIVYEVRAYLESSDVTKERGELVKIFEVVAPLDLNKEDPRIKDPLQLVFEESFNCGCICKPSPLRIDVEAGAGGACPGQALPITVNAVNDTRSEVTGVLLELQCRKRFRSQQPVAEVITPEEELVSVKTGPILARAQRNYQLKLVIPDMIALNLSNCSIMDVQYFLKATVKLSGCRNELVETLPFYIGLKPASTFGADRYVHPMAHSLPSGPIPDYPIITANQTNKPKDEIGFKSTANENENLTPSVKSNEINNSPQTNLTPQYQSPQYNNYNQGGYPNPPPNVYPVLNFSSNNPNVYPQQYPLNGYSPIVNYSPTAPPM